MEFTDANFKSEVISADIPVLVDFWAPWCGPCLMQKPIIEKLAKEMKGKDIKIGKLNVDENPQTAQKYGIMSIPTIIIFKKGKVLEQLTGLTQKDKLIEVLKSAGV